MENNNTFEEIWKRLKDSKRILMKLHDGPDGDSLGSCAAMKYVLEKQGIEVKLISKDELSENLKEFHFSKEVEFGKKLEDFDLNEFDLFLFLDHGTLTYTSEDIENILKDVSTINIDHHESNDYFGDMNYVDKKSPSCCSILVEFFQKMGAEFDWELTRRLFLGICTDTAFFIHGNSLDSLNKAVFLIEKGEINYKEEFFEPINSKPWNMKKLHGIFLFNMQKKEIDGKKIAYSFVTREEAEKNNLNLADIRLGIICMQDIKDVDIVFTLTELEENIKGSFRSVGIDTTLFSKELGGGGHKQASAFRLENMPMEEAIDKVLNTIEKIGMHKI